MFLLIYDKPILSDQPPFSDHIPLPWGWPLKENTTTLHLIVAKKLPFTITRAYFKNPFSEGTSLGTTNVLKIMTENYFGRQNMSNNLRRVKPDLVFLANDLLNGFPCCLTSVHRSAVVISSVFFSQSDHSLLLSVISVGDVLAFGVQRESVRCYSLQTTTKPTWSTMCRVLSFSPSSSLLFRFASWLKSFSQTWDGPT